MCPPRYYILSLPHTGYIICYSPCICRTRTRNGSSPTAQWGQGYHIDTDVITAHAHKAYNKEEDRQTGESATEKPEDGRTVDSRRTDAAKLAAKFAANRGFEPQTSGGASTSDIHHIRKIVPLVNGYSGTCTQIPVRLLYPYTLGDYLHLDSPYFLHTTTI